MIEERTWEPRLLAAITGVLVVFGIASVAGAAVVGIEFAVRQTVGAFVGVIALLIAAHLKYRAWRALAWPVLGIVVVLLVLVLLPFTRGIAPEINGARRWITVGAITVQPGELAKFAVVVWVAMLAAKKGERIRDFKMGVAPFLVVMSVVLGLVLLEPHLSMAVVIASIAVVILFVAGMRVSHFVALGTATAILVVLQILNAPWRLTRIFTFLNPGGAPGDASAQIDQSLIGFGAGGLFGVGFGEGQQKLGYLPYSYSDFIGSSIGEEWGFVGVTVLVSLYVLYVWLGFRIARTAPDTLGRHLAVGCTTMIGLTAFLHLAVNLALLPTTGLTLPFISYGRSSLLVSLAATGVLLNVARQRR